MLNNDLISRAAVLDAIDHERNLLIEQKRFGAEHVVVHHARRLIEELPAVDAAPVRRGRWIQYEPDLHGTKPLECGACHYLFARLYPRDFCPHCGAQMDGGNDDG